MLGGRVHRTGEKWGISWKRKIISLLNRVLSYFLTRTNESPGHTCYGCFVCVCLIKKNNNNNIIYNALNWEISTRGMAHVECHVWVYCATVTAVTSNLSTVKYNKRCSKSNEKNVGPTRFRWEEHNGAAFPSLVPAHVFHGNVCALDCTNLKNQSIHPPLHTEPWYHHVVSDLISYQHGRKNLFVRGVELTYSSLPWSEYSAIVLATALVSSHLDYCNSLLCGVPDTDLNRLQRVQNLLALLVTKTLPFTCSVPLLPSLH